MNDLKVTKSFAPENRPSFNDWCKEFNVSSNYVEPNKIYSVLREPLKPKYEETWLERISKFIGL